MKEWWIGLELREQRMLSIAVIVVAAALVYALAWKPLHTAVSHAREQVADMRAELVWMRQAARVLESRSRNPAAQVRTIDGPLADVVDQVARAQGIGKQAMALAQKNDDRLQVNMQAIAFGRFVHWLGAVRDQRVKVISMNLAPVQPGIVSVELLLARD